MSEAEIQAVNVELMSAVAEARPEAAAALYSENARLIPPGGAVVSGRDAIAAFFRSARDNGVASLVLESQELDVTGDWAVELGSYRLLAADATEIDSGRYLVVWKREGGRWRLHRDAIVTARG